MNVRTFLVSILLLAAGMSSAVAGPPRFHAGATRITVKDVVSFDAFVAYPTEAAEMPFQDGPWTIAASRDAPIASGARFPVVLFSHGGGGTLKAGGTPLPYAEIATSLAREGFIVVAPFHPAVERPLEGRPRHVRKALEAMLAEPRFAPHADPVRLGIMGFSWGGAVALISSGAVPSLAHLAAYCTGRADDPKACEGVETDGSLAKVVGERSRDALAIKALVLMEPWGALFDRTGLTSVDMPTLLFRADGSDLKPEGNIFGLAAALPRSPRLETIPGGHFVFFGPCPSSIEASAPAEVCRDAPGIDRAAVLRRTEAEIADFLGKNL